jgi:hypothetical protein
MPLALAQYQDAFARALMAVEPCGDEPGAIGRLVSQPGFAVYRNTVMKGCIDALQANYPAVARLVGDEWFRAAAAVFARESLPSHPTLLDYGRGFAEFLARFAPAAELPYLADVARLDRLWGESHAAADAPRLDPSEVATLKPDQMTRLTLRVHPAARWHWSDELPAYTLWRINRSDNDKAGEFDWRGEGALLTRPEGEVLNRPLPRAGTVFLAACKRGASIAVAVGETLSEDAQVDLAALTDVFLQAGAFSGLLPCTEEETHP